MSRTCLFVLGMHRSGTSAMAGALSFLGMGFDSDLVEAVPNDNPKGYWEPVDVVNINNDIFTAFNMHYMDFGALPNGWMQDKAIVPIRQRINDWFKRSFLEASCIVVKDPRLCRTLPLWLEVLEQQQIKAKCIHVFRHPMEVVNSLRVRDNDFSVVDGLLVWLAHVFDSFLYSPPKNSVVISYGALMRDPVLVLEAVAQSLEIEWPVHPDTVAESLKAFLEPSLTHQHFKGNIPYPPLNSLVKSVFDCLVNYDLKSSDEDFYFHLERYQIQFQELRCLFESVLGRYLCKLEAEQVNAKEQIAYRDALVSDMKEQLEAEKVNAKEQIAYRDALVADLEKLLGSRKDLVKLFFRPLKKGDS